MTINGTPIDKAQLLHLIDNNDKIQAIKYVYEFSNLNLKESKDVVDNLEHNPYHYANDTITVSKSAELSDLEYEQNTSGPKRGNHFINEKPSNIKTYLIVLFLLFFGLLIFYLYAKQ